MVMIQTAAYLNAKKIVYIIKRNKTANVRKKADDDRNSPKFR